MTPKVIWARRIAGDLYDCTYSYGAGVDCMAMHELRMLALHDRAGIEIDRSGHRGAGEPSYEFLSVEDMK